jgi:hypothetical protein
MALGAVPGGIRAVARAAIPGLLKQGLGSNAIINYLKPKGLTYRRVNMLADIRHFSGLAKLENTVKVVAGDVIFPRYAMVETEYRAARRYYVKARMTILDEDTLEESERWVSFYDNTRKSKDQWSADFVRGYMEGRYGVSELIQDVSIASVEHKRGWAH